MRNGLGSESQPYFSVSGTAGIDKEIKALSERGGLVHLPNGLVFTTPDARLLVSGRDNSLTGVPEERILYI